MTVLLNRTTAGLAAGTIQQFSTNLESALVAQGAASVSAGAITSGAQTNNLLSGRAAVATGASSVVITNSRVDANTIINAVISQTTADSTALTVTRVMPAAGSFTIFVTANTTAATVVAWSIADTGGLSQSNATP